jgi:gamma-glutamyl:cysteine ligase YbdK (ATP-grasp superfamily)
MISYTTNNSFKDHLLKLEMVLARLSTAGMRVNISKSKFFAEQIEYLGYWITRNVIQPIHNKVEMDAILNYASLLVKSTMIAICGFAEVSF